MKKNFIKKTLPNCKSVIKNELSVCRSLTAHNIFVRFLHSGQWQYFCLVAIIKLRCMALVLKTELSAQFEQILMLRFKNY